MNEEQQAAHDIRRFVRTLGQLAELPEGLESLGSMKQAELEAKARKELIDKEVDRLKEQAASMIAQAEAEVKKRFDDAAAELYKFQVQTKQAEDNLLALEAKTAETTRMYNDAQKMLDEIVRKVRT